MKYFLAWGVQMGDGRADDLLENNSKGTAMNIFDALKNARNDLVAVVRRQQLEPSIRLVKTVRPIRERERPVVLDASRLTFPRK